MTPACAQQRQYGFRFVFGVFQERLEAFDGACRVVIAKAASTHRRETGERLSQAACTFQESWLEQWGPSVRNELSDDLSGARGVLFGLGACPYGCG